MLAGSGVPVFCSSVVSLPDIDRPGQVAVERRRLAPPFPLGLSIGAARLGGRPVERINRFCWGWGGLRGHWHSPPNFASRSTRSLFFQATQRGEIRTGRGNRPDFTPVKKLVREIGKSGAMPFLRSPTITDSLEYPCGGRSGLVWALWPDINTPWGVVESGRVFLTLREGLLPASAGRPVCAKVPVCADGKLSRLIFLLCRD